MSLRPLAFTILIVLGAGCEECTVDPPPDDGSVEDARLEECALEGEPCGADQDCCPGHRCLETICRLEGG